MVTLREILNLKQESASFIKLLNWMRLSPRMVLRVPIIMCFILSFRREKISAKVADGILEVEIPKLTPKEEAKTTKNIEVK